MARLKDSERARLPDSAFAYIDSRGHRRLPIHDEPHVRAALSRFGQVKFEDDAARERARKRLLRAAKRYGIVPVGFIDGQLRSERELGKVQAGSIDVATLPTGFVTFLLTDIENSTALLRRLGDRYAGLLNDVRGIVRGAVAQAGGREVDTRADEFFAAFGQVLPAVEAAVAIQRELGSSTWPDQVECRLRVAIHSGEPTLTETGYIGLAVHAAARVCAIANGGQILISGESTAAIEGGSMPDGVTLRALGKHRLAGLTHSLTLHQVEADGLVTEFPPLGGRASTTRSGP